MSIRNICICTETERDYQPFRACPAHNAAKDVTREPGDGQELREAARLSPDGALVAVRRGPNDWRVSNGGHYRDVHVADWTPLTPVPELAALIADAERVRELEATVARVRTLATAIRETPGMGPLAGALFQILDGDQ